MKDLISTEEKDDLIRSVREHVLGKARTHQDDEEEEDAELDRDDLFEFCTVRKRHCSSSEMNEYLSASFSREDLNADPLQFWQKSSCSSPKLAKVAVKLYSTPASSMLAEELFSVLNRVLTEDRSSLNPDTVNKVLFICSNCDLV